VIPDTIGAVLAFLGLIAPGLLFEMLRERRRPMAEQTAFREASRIALTSFVFTLAGIAVAALIRTVRPSAMADPGRWLRDGNAYARDNYPAVLTTFATIVVVSALLALVTDLALRRFAKGQGIISPGSVWYHVFDFDRPKPAETWVHVRLIDGSTFSGYMRHYTTGEKLEDREITLGGRFLRHGEKGHPETRIDGDWDLVTIRGDKIVFMRAVYYSAVTDEFVGRDRKPVKDRIPPAPAAVAPTTP
jgi:hypothetical protein